MTKKPYVIIGGGAAAANCIEGIRSADPTGEIIVISAETHDIYGRPLISYYLQGRTDPEKMLYRGKNFYERNAVTALKGKKAVSIDTKKKTVTLDDGTEQPYAKLCIAAGSSPFVPPFEGLQSVEKKTGFMTMDDALYLEKNTTPESDVLIVGAGLIGLKCAEGLLGRVRSITVCDLADRVLSSILDGDTASIVQKHLEAQGISFLLGDSAASFKGDTALMKSGKSVRFDMLVLAVGVRPNTKEAKEAGIAVDRGILTDTQSRTSVKDVYAAGDCTQTTDITSGLKKIMAILPSAAMQGLTAGINMVGGNAEFDKAVPMNSIGFCGLHMMSAGTYDGERIEVRDGDTVKLFFVKDDKLTGYILLGNVERAGIYTSLVRERTPLSTIDFEAVKTSPSLLPFSAEKRGKLAGGVL